MKYGMFLGLVIVGFASTPPAQAAAQAEPNEAKSIRCGACYACHGDGANDKGFCWVSDPIPGANFVARKVAWLIPGMQETQLGGMFKSLEECRNDMRKPHADKAGNIFQCLQRSR